MIQVIQSPATGGTAEDIVKDGVSAGVLSCVLHCEAVLLEPCVCRCVCSQTSDLLICVSSLKHFSFSSFVRVN